MRVSNDHIKVMVDLDTMNLYPLYNDGLSVDVKFIEELIAESDDWRYLDFSNSNKMKIEEKHKRVIPKIMYRGIYDGHSEMDNDYPTVYYSCDFGINSNGIKLWVTLPDSESNKYCPNISKDIKTGEIYMDDFKTTTQITKETVDITMCMNIVTPKILTIHKVPYCTEYFNPEYYYVEALQDIIHDAKSSVIIIHEKAELKGLIYYHSMKELMKMSDEYIEEFDSSNLTEGDLLHFGYARIEFNIDENGNIVGYTPILSFTPPSYQHIKCIADCE